MTYNFLMDQNLTGRHDGVQSQASSSVRSESSVARAHNTVESELEALKTKYEKIAYTV